MATHYVSTTGSNSASGLSLNSAFATLERAQTAMRLSGGDDTTLIRGGSEGADSMFGGLGADVFQFKAANDSGVIFSTLDKIEDYEDGIDKIHLWQIDANANRTGNQAFRLSGTGLFTGEGGSLRIIERNGDTLIMQISTATRLPISPSNLTGCIP